jgi:DNA-binding transcriptional ArsR family regulator
MARSLSAFAAVVLEKPFGDDLLPLVQAAIASGGQRPTEWDSGIHVRRRPDFWAVPPPLGSRSSRVQSKADGTDLFYLPLRRTGSRRSGPKPARPRRSARHRYYGRAGSRTDADRRRRSADPRLPGAYRRAVRLYKALPDGRRQVVDFLVAGDCFGLFGADHYAYSVEAIVPSASARYARVNLEAGLRADYLGLTIETVSRTLTRLRQEGVITFASPQDVILQRPLELEALACDPS